MSTCTFMCLIINLLLFALLGKVCRWSPAPVEVYACG